MLVSFSEDLQILGDHMVCINWIIAYAMCLMGSLKENKPGFPPLASAVILPWEIISFFQVIDYGMHFVSISRFFWCSIHTAFFIVALKKLYGKKPIAIILRLSLFLIVTVSLIFVFKNPLGQIRTSFFNTIVSWIILIIYIIKSDYPPSRLYFGFAVFGFIADAFGHLVYLNVEPVTSFLCITLQVIQLIHVILVFVCLKKAKVKIFLSPVQIINDFENTVTTKYRELATFVNKQILKKEPSQKRRKYKKRIKHKQTHRKK